MKLSYEDKIEIYHLWKEQYWGYKRISKKFNLSYSSVEYLVKLIDIHGKSIVQRDKNKKYTAEFKHECIWQVSLSLGITSKGLLNSWIKSFKENGCIIEKKRGRYAKNKTEKEEICKSLFVAAHQVSFQI